MQPPLRVVEAEQERTHQLTRAVLVPAEAGHHAVRGAGVLHLDHGALARLVRRRLVFGDHAVEAGALEPMEPLVGERAIACAGRDVQAAAGLRESALEP